MLSFSYELWLHSKSYILWNLINKYAMKVTVNANTAPTTTTKYLCLLI
jgi:hypothetical protein